MALSPVTRTTLVGDVDNGEDCICRGRAMWEKKKKPFAQFCCEPKVAKFITLKKKTYYT